MAGRIIMAYICALSAVVSAHVTSEIFMALNPQLSSRQVIKVGPNHESRRSLLAKGALGTVFLLNKRAIAIGPTNVDLVNPVYESVVCPTEYQDEINYENFQGVQGRLATKNERKDFTKMCVRVRAKATNPLKKPMTNVAIYGYVFDDEAGTTVVGNTLRNDREKSHAGQIAKLSSIPPGTSTIEFMFIATVDKAYGGRLPSLRFESLKGTSSPGGKILEAFGPCDIDSTSKECEEAESE